MSGEYLDIEFAPQIEPKFHNLERIIDDFILFCVLVGNDFLPCLPFAEIGQHGLEDLFRVYKDHLASSSASSSFWLTKNCGEVDFKQHLGLSTSLFQMVVGAAQKDRYTYFGNFWCVRPVFSGSRSF